MHYYIDLLLLLSPFKILFHSHPLKSLWNSKDPDKDNNEQDNDLFPTVSVFQLMSNTLKILFFDAMQTSHLCHSVTSVWTAVQEKLHWKSQWFLGLRSSKHSQGKYSSFFICAVPQPQSTEKTHACRLPAPAGIAGMPKWPLWEGSFCSPFADIWGKSARSDNSILLVAGNSGQHL